MNEDVYTFACAEDYRAGKTGYKHRPSSEGADLPDGSQPLASRALAILQSLGGRWIEAGNFYELLGASRLRDDPIRKAALEALRDLEARGLVQTNGSGRWRATR